MPKKLLVVGAGVIGLELGSVWRRLGAEVTVVEFLDRITPGIDGEVGKAFQRILTKQGFSFPALHQGDGRGEERRRPDGDGRTGGGRRQISTIECRYDAGRHRPHSLHRQIWVWRKWAWRWTSAAASSPINHYRTNVAGIYAIGDCREGAMLAHKAEDEAVACAEIIAGKAGHVNYDAIPSVVYTFPEVATVGKSEEELKAAGIAYKVGKFPFTANARAKTIAATDGLVKILADAKTDKVLGCAIVGPGSRQPDRGSGAGDGVRRVVGRHRAHLPFASDADGSGAPGGYGCRGLDDANVTSRDSAMSLRGFTGSACQNHVNTQVTKPIAAKKPTQVRQNIAAQRSVPWAPYPCGGE